MFRTEPPSLHPRQGAPTSRERPRNRLLARLSPDEHERLRPMLEHVALKPRRALHLPKLPMTECYFVEAGLVATLADADEGSHAVCAWMVGSEGLVGAPVILGLETTRLRRTVLIEGAAWRISASNLRRAMDEIGTLRDVLLEYVHAMLIETAQSVACNARHSVGQRLARWLLTAHDRVSGNELRLTHATLAKLLGVRRATITQAVHLLQDAGVVTLARNELRIVDRCKLEQCACHCYRVIKTRPRHVNGSQ